MVVDDVKTSMKMIFEILVKTDSIEMSSPRLEMQSQGSYSLKQYEYHQGATGHNIEECAAFKVKVHRLMTFKVLVIERPWKRMAKKDTGMINDGGSLVPQAITQAYPEQFSTLVFFSIFSLKPIVFYVTSSFSYQNRHNGPLNCKG